jgi:hypothetical protein
VAPRPLVSRLRRRSRRRWAGSPWGRGGVFLCARNRCVCDQGRREGHAQKARSLMSHLRKQKMSRAFGPPNAGPYPKFATTTLPRLLGTASRSRHSVRT